MLKKILLLSCFLFAGNDNQMVQSDAKDYIDSSAHHALVKDIDDKCSYIYFRLITLHFMRYVNSFLEKNGMFEFISIDESENLIRKNDLNGFMRKISNKLDFSKSQINEEIQKMNMYLKGREYIPNIFISGHNEVCSCMSLSSKYFCLVQLNHYKKVFETSQFKDNGKSIQVKNITLDKGIENEIKEISRNLFDFKTYIKTAYNLLMDPTVDMFKSIEIFDKLCEKSKIYKKSLNEKFTYFKNKEDDIMNFYKNPNSNSYRNLLVYGDLLSILNMYKKAKNNEILDKIDSRK